MVFKPKFFLDLGSEGERQKPVTVAPVVARPEPEAVKVESGPVVVARGPAAPGGASASVTPPTPVTSAAATAPAVTPAASSTGSLTTAEAIAAELAAAQANRPAPSLATFAPDCVAAGGALPQRRRRGSADLGGFREMARGMLRS